MLRDSRLRDEYTGFMQEYSEMGQMRRLTEVELLVDQLRVYYNPHHAIWQRKDGGQKLRVVFNASCPTTSGRSLNNILRPGPKMQSNLTVFLTRWRRWSMAYCADIQMMFRQSVSI